MRAILAGVNHYLDPGDELRGCIPDAQNLWRLLNFQLDIPEREIVLLKDRQAAAEKAIVKTLVESAGPGTHLIWSHSSHGTNNPDPAQKDGLQELLCCTDTREKNGLWDLDTVISAQWIGQTIALLHPEARLDIIIDACHAPEGSQLKALGRSYGRARFMPRSEVGVPVKPLASRVIQAGIPANVCLWSACAPWQTSADAYIDGAWQGAFTAAFLKAFKPGRSRSDIIFHARKWLAVHGYRQEPHLYGHGAMVQEALR